MEIEKEVENFKDVIRADYKKWLDEKLLMKKDIRVYVDALYQGYLDACRTFKWSSESEVKKCKNDVDKREKNLQRGKTEWVCISDKGIFNKR